MLVSLLLLRTVFGGDVADTKPPGHSCQGQQTDISFCNDADCEAPACIDCEWGDWMDYASCTCLGLKERHRVIRKQNNDCGWPCEGPKVETAQCKSECHGVQNCELSDWSEWSECDKECGGGQKFSSREVVVEAEPGGVPCEEDLKKTARCNEHPCFEPEDCVVSDWSQWTECSVTCDMGQASRNRDIVSLAKHGGPPCEAQLSQTKGCTFEPCAQSVTCQWGDWSEWSACSQTCGGGNMSRSRLIVKAPRYGGDLCPANDMSEVAACGTDACSEVEDCSFGEWSDWDACSCTCNGIQHRVRHIDIYPKQGGKPCDGALRDLRSCNVETCIRKEKRMEQEKEQRQREQAILQAQLDAQAAALSAGSPPVSGATTECPPGPAGPEGEGEGGVGGAGGFGQIDLPEDCEFSQWDTWGACSSSCGVGQRKRSRIIAQNPSPDGRPCQGETVTVEACEEGDCPLPEGEDSPRDCLWSDWDEWGACSASCGGGERIRQRQIATMPNGAGKPCDTNPSMEVVGCNISPCGCSDCKWKPWTEWGACTCTGIVERHRNFSGLRSGCGTPCAGPKTVTKTCHPDCNGKSVNCVWEEWSPWTDCTRECGGGQRERGRNIRVQGFHGGKPCEGSEKSVEVCGTKSCLNSVDCKLSDWTSWSECTLSCGGGQALRTRQVDVNPAHLGIGCNDVLCEIRACGTELCEPITDCVWADWEEWSTCTATCGGGHKSRTRNILTAPKSGGQLCSAEIKEEMEACSTVDCSSKCVDAKFGDWSEWGECTASCGEAYRTRHRVLAQTANECGNAAEGKLQEYESCPSAPCEQNLVDCGFSDWSDWSDCSCSCNGVLERSRRVLSYPQNGGLACIGALKEITPCNVKKCDLGQPRDCALEQWGPWTACNRECNGGIQTRIRSIGTRPLFGGAPCEGAMKVVRNCALKKCTGCIDCMWGAWKEWGTCSILCGGGQQTRYRHIIQMPQGGGKPCEDKASTEVQGCNTHTCGTTHICEWTPWMEWSMCSETCGQGERERTRKLKMTALSVTPVSQVGILSMLQEDMNTHTIERLGMVFCFGALASALLFFGLVKVLERRTGTARHSNSESRLNLLEPEDGEAVE